MGSRDLSEPVDIAIVGAGPAGTAAAIEAGRAGLSSVIIESAPFPRFHIGESLSGEAARMLREWGLGGEIDRAGHPIKRGTSVFGRSARPFYVPVVALKGAERRRTPSTTWQVDRSDFDDILLRRAVAGGSEVVRGTAADVLTNDAGRVCGVNVLCNEGAFEIRSRFVIDASGGGRFMQKLGYTGAQERGSYDRQIAFFTHLRGVDRGQGDDAEQTRIYWGDVYRWAWLIPVGPELTSIGFVAPSKYFRSLQQSPDDFVLSQMRELHPELAGRVSETSVEFAVKSAHNYSYQIHDFTGAGWLAIGDAHRFIDPIFSFGVNSAIAEGCRAAMLCAQAVAEDVTEPGAVAALFKPFEAWADDGQQIVQDLVDGFWGNAVGFGYLVHGTRHHDDMVDIFAGRVYGIESPSEGLQALRRFSRKITPS